MKNTFLFLLLSFSIALFFLNGLIEDTLRIASSEKALIENHSSEDILKFLERNSFSKESQKDSVPKVELVLPAEKKLYSWDTQIRYVIKVSDKNDGDSKYGEINGNAVLLEIEYLPIADEVLKQKKKISEKEHKGLELMKRSTCFGCHADKTTLAGPSFSEMAARYEKNSETLKSLAGNISGGSSGMWGNSIMPAHPDLTEKESEYIADYILTQGRKKNNWILPGLEGTFRVIQKPGDCAKGLYILTASYISKSNAKGTDSVILEIE